MERKKPAKRPERFSHKEYRSAGVAHLINTDQEAEFYYRGKPIPKEKADEMAAEHWRKKNGLSGQQ